MIVNYFVIHKSSLFYCDDGLYNSLDGSFIPTYSVIYQYQYSFFRLCFRLANLKFIFGTYFGGSDCLFAMHIYEQNHGKAKNHFNQLIFSSLILFNPNQLISRSNLFKSKFDCNKFHTASNQ